jgi:hypothetical protein
MEIWVQYTLDLTEKDKPDGTLILGGWGTDQLCYKFVKEKDFDNAGFHHGQEIAALGQDRVFVAEINRCAWRSKHISLIGKRIVELAYSDDFLYVYKLATQNQDHYNVKSGKWEADPSPKLVALVLFLRSIPIHLPKVFKAFLHDHVLCPKPNSDTDPDPDAVSSLDADQGAAWDTESPNAGTADSDSADPES